MKLVTLSLVLGILLPTGLSEAQTRSTGQNWTPSPADPVAEGCGLDGANDPETGAWAASYVGFVSPYVYLPVAQIAHRLNSGAAAPAEREGLARSYRSAAETLAETVIERMDAFPADQNGLLIIATSADEIERMKRCIRIDDRVTARMAGSGQYASEMDASVLRNAERLAPAGVPVLLGFFETADSDPARMAEWTALPSDLRALLARQGVTPELARGTSEARRQAPRRELAVTEQTARKPAHASSTESRAVRDVVQALNRSLFPLGWDGWGRVQDAPYTVGTNAVYYGATVQTQVECSDDGQHLMFVSVTVEPDAGWVFDADQGLEVDWGDRRQHIPVAQAGQGRTYYQNTITFNFIDTERTRQMMASAENSHPLDRFFNQMLGPMVLDQVDSGGRAMISLPEARASQVMRISAFARINGQLRKLQVLDASQSRDVDIEALATTCGFY